MLARRARSNKPHNDMHRLSVRTAGVLHDQHVCQARTRARVKKSVTHSVYMYLTITVRHLASHWVNQGQPAVNVWCMPTATCTRETRLACTIMQWRCSLNADVRCVQTQFLGIVGLQQKAGNGRDGKQHKCSCL